MDIPSEDRVPVGKVPTENESLFRGGRIAEKSPPGSNSGSPVNTKTYKNFSQIVGSGI